jgi:hypothetical protein
MYPMYDFDMYSIKKLLIEFLLGSLYRFIKQKDKKFKSFLSFFISNVAK